MFRTLPALLFISLLLLLHTATAATATTLAPIEPNTADAPLSDPNIDPVTHFSTNEEELEEDTLSVPTTSRRIFATARVFNIIRRYRRFAPLALNADPRRTAQIRSALLVCLRSLRRMQSMDNPRNVRTLLSGLVLLLDWLACLLN